MDTIMHANCGPDEIKVDDECLTCGGQLKKDQTEATKENERDLGKLCLPKYKIPPSSATGRCPDDYAKLEGECYIKNAAQTNIRGHHVVCPKFYTLVYGGPHIASPNYCVLCGPGRVTPLKWKNGECA